MDTLEEVQRTNHLMAKISDVRQSIDDLKLKIQLEKQFIDQQKRKIQESQSQVIITSVILI